MEIIAFLIDFILHVDKHLEAFVAAYGVWVYALLFLIVFVETGVVVMPFLPGDSLLFIVGALCGAGLMDYRWPRRAAGGRHPGRPVQLLDRPLLRPQGVPVGELALVQPPRLRPGARFYERYGGITIVLARFMPFIRTFAPFVAGVAAMGRSKFTAYNVGGALLWVLGICTAGYFFGNLPWVREHLDKIIWALILVPGLIAIFGAWRAGRQGKVAAG
jgi:membrane-associated protein